MEAKKYSYYSDKEYNEYLKRLIPLLDPKKIPTREGGEGQVFFINDDFVVKKYHGSYTKSEAKLFDLYCQEISAFYHSRDCNIPRTYSWISVPSNAGPETFRLYLLQERIKGNELFGESSFDISRPQIIKPLNAYYKFCRTFCSEEEFITAITQKSGALFEKITEEYIRYFLNINSELLSMPTKNVDDFILSVYKTRRFRKFSVPDVGSRNIIFDGKKLTLIDLGWEETIKPILQENEDYSTMTLNDILGIFGDNYFCVSFVNRHAKLNPASRINKLKTYNMRVCAEAIKRFVKETNRLISPIVSYNTGININTMTNDLNSFLMPPDTNSIMNEIQRDY